MNRFKWEKKYLYWGVTAFLVIIACIAFFWVIQRWDGVKSVFSSINAILSPFIIGAVIAFLLTPFVKVFQSNFTDAIGEKLFKKNPGKAKKFGRGIAVFLSILLMIGLFVAFFSVVIPQLYKSIESIVLNISSSISRVEAWANKWLADYPDVEKVFTGFVGDIGTEFSKWAKSTLLPQMNDILTSVSVGVISVVKAIINIFVAVVVSVYIMYSREKFTAQGKKALYSILPIKYVNKVLRGLRVTGRSFMNYISGQLLDALIVGVICYFACLIIGIKDAVLVAVLIGITNIIPFFGPFIGGIPAALIVLMSSYVQCIIFVIFIIVLQQLDGNILSPRILGNATGMSGFWVLFALLVGSGLLGPIGMIVGVPLFAVIYMWLKSLVRGKLKKRGLPMETAAYADLDHIDIETGEPVPISHETGKGNNAEKDGGEQK